MEFQRIDEKSFSGNVKLLKLLGLYPYSSCPKIYPFYAYTFYVLFTCPTPTLCMVNLFFVEEITLQRVANTFFMITQIGILIVKLLPFKNNPEGEVLVDKCVKTCKNIFHLFYAFCLATLFTWPLKALFNQEEGRRTLPAEVWLPFDAYEDITVYCAVFVFVWLCVANAAGGNAALDTLVAGLICHAATQVAILKDTLEDLARTVDDQIEEESEMMSEAEKNQLRSRTIYKKICECIDHYDAIDQFVKDLEKTYSFVVFTQFVASILVICISCLQLSIVKPFTVPFFAMVIFVTTMLTEIYLFCYYGTVLYEESDSIVNAIYMSEWYNYDNKSKKALITLMERAKRPMVVTAGKLLDLSLVTFTTIIRRSYSLLAVLKNYSN
ncbi:hypothetical protein NQ318_007184 [Aromia moschata]|uniref:Odorant receptor n=1 Tax=Aromia moschata TaxID=1265417 RepID=A0AAV8XXT1_9CUCU|nr:hypothetical protein NQ318_007184 [Aromia moschata]